MQCKAMQDPVINDYVSVQECNAERTSRLARLARTSRVSLTNMFSLITNETPDGALYGS